jgi:hypothetical protein
MSSSRRLIETAVDGLVISSPTRFSWFGQVMLDVPEQVQKEMPPATARAYLLYSIQTHLYENFYCRGTAAPARDGPIQPPVQTFTPFVAELSANNLGRGTREPGWHVRGIENGTAVVERDGLSLWVPLAETWPRARNGETAGQTVSVSFPNELLHLSPGFYMALGDRWLDVEKSGAVLRFYWHLRSEGASTLLRAVTSRLNRRNLPFRLKVVNDPGRFIRCDAGVLYTRQRDYPLLRDLVADVYAEMAAYLEWATPVFTKRLAPGLGFAEDMGAGDSFGMHRCGLLAEGLVRAYERSPASLADRVKQVEQVFKESGVSLAAPYLRPGSRDRYGFRLH